MSSHVVVVAVNSAGRYVVVVGEISGAVDSVVVVRGHHHLECI
jgi:ribosomal protein L3